MKRVMCVDDSGIVGLYSERIKFGEIYVVDYEFEAPCCGTLLYALVGIGGISKRPYVRHITCGKTMPNTKEWSRDLYKASRFIDIDEYADLIEVEQSQKETV